jgi:Tol biopolymer transport system component
VIATIGAGGMGKVFRARDTRLDRDVALKILAEHVTREPHSRERFEREARAVSRLNHPNICTLHDVGKADVGGLEHQYLVMELVEGETLAARLRRGLLPLDHALRYAIQIAEALAAAHQHGVVHRDLKPANVMLTARGAKLLDFGLAHLHAPAESLEMGATTTQLTAVGVVAGTLPYMSPEQLRGEDVDARSDVFAFGALLYEIITGVRPFSGGSSVELMASVLERETPTLPDSESGPRRALDRLIKNCLVKDRAERWQSARDAALQLRGIDQDLAAPAHVTHPSRRATVAFWLLLAAAAFAGGYLLHQRSAVMAPAVTMPGRFMLDLAPDVTRRVLNPAIAPDGRTLVFTPETESDTRIVAHQLDTGERRNLAQAPGLDSGWGTSWSTDGRSLLYYSSGVLYAFDLATGARRQVLELASGPSLHAGVAQNSAGTILLGGTRLRRLDAGAQTARDVYATDATVLGQYWPSFLPNGRDFVFAQASSDQQRAGVILGSLDLAEPVRLTNFFSNAQVSPSGHLLLGQDGSLVAQRLDVSARALRGEAVVIAADVSQIDGFVHMAIGSDGMVVYVPVSRNIPTAELLWFNRDGTPAGKIGTPGHYRQVAMAADARRLALEEIDETRPNTISLLGATVGRMLTLTPPPTSQSSFQGLVDPALSRDGQRLAYTAWVENDADLFISEGTGQEPIRIALPGTQWAESFSPDGKLLLYAENELGGHVSLRAISLQGDRTPRILVDTPAMNDEPHVSPSGKWLAYTSNRSGRFEVYVQRFDVRSEPWRVSSDGGGQPKWRADGQELYFLTADGMMMRVTGFEGQEPGKTEPLFRTPLKPSPNLDEYAVTGKGDRFLLIVPLPSREPVRLNVLTNWAARLRAQ